MPARLRRPPRFASPTPGGTAPASVRAVYGTNKQANAAHGADSPEAARREISLIFGADLVEPGGEAGVARTGRDMLTKHVG